MASPPSDSDPSTLIPDPIEAAADNVVSGLEVAADNVVSGPGAAAENVVSGLEAVTIPSGDNLVDDTDRVGYGPLDNYHPIYCNGAGYCRGDVDNPCVPNGAGYGCGKVAPTYDDDRHLG